MPHSVKNDDDLSAVFERAHERAATIGLPYAGAVTPAEASALSTAGEADIVDVRSRYEWEFVGHADDSLLIEWRCYQADGQTSIKSVINPDFLAQLGRAFARDQPILFLCRSAVRSHHAAAAAAEAGYTKAYNILEGFEGDKDDQGRRGTRGGWRMRGLPWVQG
ncbi:MAG: rhodanese-like domain-containing protein [Burkholderiales bacterium]